jgi:hypothetical protein
MNMNAFDICCSDLDDFVYKQLEGQKKIIISEDAFRALSMLPDKQKAASILFNAINWQMNGTEPEGLEGSDLFACSLLADSIGIFGPSKEE